MKVNYNTLKACCNADIQQFRQFGTVTNTPAGIYIYNSKPENKILAVAHLDTVLTENYFQVKRNKKDHIVYSAQLDDRLGAYTLLYLLPQFGINCDILLTEGEEVGNSTGLYFTPDKDYNWMFSFDRRGEDVVLYQYDDNPTRELLKQHGFVPALGSFSDIAFMDHLNIKGFNIGTGYYGEHSTQSYASIGTLYRQIKRLQSFYLANVDNKLEHKKDFTPYRYRSNYSYYMRDDWYDDLYCYLCRKNQGKYEVDTGIFLCSQCLNDADQCQVCNEIVYNYEITDGKCFDCLLPEIDN
jgi:hypothetical protein